MHNVLLNVSKILLCDIDDLAVLNLRDEDLDSSFWTIHKEVDIMGEPETVFAGNIVDKGNEVEWINQEVDLQPAKFGNLDLVIMQEFDDVYDINFFTSFQKILKEKNRLN